jgi:mono/diheme cytochrome c family protein
MSTKILIVAAVLIATGIYAAGPVAAQKSAVTFSQTIAPIVYANCVTCHRPGEAAPFSLIAYDDVRRRGKLLVAVTQQRLMPPWQATHGYGDFEGERRLTDEQIEAIADWVNTGMPEGDVARMPPLPKFPDGWHLGTPDLVLTMTDGFDVPASGPDIFRNFVIPTGLTEDKWVRAVEFRPSARAVVHHALFAYVPGDSLRTANGADGRPGFRGLAPIGLTARGAGSGPLGGWAVGATPRFLPDGEALPIARNADIVLQMHFHPTGKAQREQSTVGIYFAKTPPERRMLNLQLPGLFGVGAGIDIPAGEKAYTIESSATLPVDVRLFAANPHAHYLAKEMKATATLPDGTTRPLLWIQNWDFNWQDGYNYKEPVTLPKGSRIDVRISYDNSATNPHNPSSPVRRVEWGEQSTDEMGTIGFMLQPVRREDEPAWQLFAAQWLRTTLQNAVRNGTVERLRESRALQGLQ